MPRYLQHKHVWNWITRRSSLILYMQICPHMPSFLLLFCLREIIDVDQLKGDKNIPIIHVCFACVCMHEYWWVNPTVFFVAWYLSELIALWPIYPWLNINWANQNAKKDYHPEQTGHSLVKTYSDTCTPVGDFWYLLWFEQTNLHVKLLWFFNFITFSSFHPFLPFIASLL